MVEGVPTDQILLYESVEKLLHLYIGAATSITNFDNLFYDLTYSFHIFHIPFHHLKLDLADGRGVHLKNLILLRFCLIIITFKIFYSCMFIATKTMINIDELDTC